MTPQGNLPATLKRVAALGRDGDTDLAHVSKGDVVVPVERLSDASTRKAFKKFLMDAGIKKARFTVGDKRSTRTNPRTGLEEFADSDVGGGGEGGGDTAGGTGGGLGGGGGPGDVAGSPGANDTTGASAPGPGSGDTTGGFNPNSNPEMGGSKERASQLGMIDAVAAGAPMGLSASGTRDPTTGIFGTSYGIDPGRVAGGLVGNVLGGTLGPIGGFAGGQIGGQLGKGSLGNDISLGVDYGGFQSNTGLASLGPTGTPASQPGGGGGSGLGGDLDIASALNAALGASPPASASVGLPPAQPTQQAATLAPTGRNTVVGPRQIGSPGLAAFGPGSVFTDIARQLGR